MKSRMLYMQYGTLRIPYQVQYSERKTLGISVAPSKVVTITAPLNTSKEKITEKITQRAYWISRQLRGFNSLQILSVPKLYEMVSGETFYYLGRRYRLKVIQSTTQEVSISGRYLYVRLKNRADKKQVENLLRLWYHTRAKEVLTHRFSRYSYILQREKIVVNSLLIRSLMKRWGSCTVNNNIVLSISLAQAPLSCIDYVIIHEICHLKYLNHSNQFHRLLNKYLPDWENRKKQLEEIPVF